MKATVTGNVLFSLSKYKRKLYYLILSFNTSLFNSLVITLFYRLHLISTRPPRPPQHHTTMHILTASLAILSVVSLAQQGFAAQSSGDYYLDHNACQGISPIAHKTYRPLVSEQSTKDLLH